MPASPRIEIPEPGKSFLLRYDADNTSLPIIGVVQNLHEGDGRNTPAIGTAHPDTTTYPNHVFVGTEVRAEDQRILWVYRILPGALTTIKLYDKLTQTLVTETRQDVLNSTVDPTITALYVDFRREPRNGNSGVDTFITTTYPSSITSKTLTEYQRERYVYPALLKGFSTDVLTQRPQNGQIAGRTFPFITKNIEAERPRTVPHKITTTFTVTAPTNTSIMSGLTDINPVRHDYNGVHFDFITGPVLSDALSIDYTTGTDDPLWTLQTETYASAASSPTMTAYVAGRVAGNWMGIDRQSKLIANGLYMLVLVEIPIK